MTSAEFVFDELRTMVRERILRDRQVAGVSDVEVRRTLNELSAELRAGRDFEEALAMAARPVHGLGDEEEPCAASVPLLPNRPRRLLVSVAESDDERQARHRALFEGRQRRAAAARPAPRALPPKAPVRVEPSLDLEELGGKLLELLEGGPRGAYDLAFRLVDDPSPHDVGAALWLLHGRGLVERVGRGRPVFWKRIQVSSSGGAS